MNTKDLGTYILAKTTFKGKKGWSIFAKGEGENILITTSETDHTPKYGLYQYKHEGLKALKGVTREQRIQFLQRVLPENKETICFTVKKGIEKVTYYCVLNDELFCLDEDIHLITHTSKAGKKPEEYIKVPSYIDHPSTYLFDLFKILRRPLNVKEI